MKKSISNLTYALMCASLLGAGGFTVHEAWSPNGMLAESAETQAAMAMADGKMSVARVAVHETTVLTDAELITELRAAHDRRINGEEEPARVVEADAPVRTPFPVSADGPAMFHGSEAGPIVSINGTQGNGWVQGDPIAFEQNFVTQMAFQSSNGESAAERDARAARERIRQMGNKAAPTAMRSSRGRSAASGLLALRQRLDNVTDRRFKRLDFVSRLRSQRAALRTYQERRARANRTGTLRSR